MSSNLVERKTLYGLAKNGKVKVWKIGLYKKANYTDIVIETGYEGGVLTKHVRPVQKGKNIGRSNETNHYSQAKFDAAALYSKKRDDGYVENREQLAAQEYLRPMLAQKYDRKRVDSWGGGNIFVQPKLNGVRCITHHTQDGELKMYSRKGKPFDVILKQHKHLVESLKKGLPRGEYLDGELYIHGTALQDIVSAVKAFGNNTKKLQYWIYDRPTDASQRFRDRFAMLENINEALGKFVSLVPTYHLTDTKDLDEYYDHFLKKGYEGLIARNGNAAYELGSRSYQMLKRKDFRDEEFKIIGATHDINKCVVWMCRSHHNRDKEPFNVVPVGTDKERQQLWVDADKYFGKMLTVRYLELSKDGFPIGNPVGVAIRDYE